MKEIKTDPVATRIVVAVLIAQMDDEQRIAAVVRLRQLGLDDAASAIERVEAQMPR